MENNVYVNTNDELVFPSRKRRTPNEKYCRIRISDEAYDIIAEIEARTGYAMNFIASEMIKYAEAHTVIGGDSE